MFLKDVFSFKLDNQLVEKDIEWLRVLYLEAV